MLTAPRMNHKSRLILLATATLCLNSVAVADSGDPPLFVATSGVDSGDCQVATAPCRTIGYALQRVGKHGQIRVAGGDYTLQNVADVFYLLSGAIDVHGGYRVDDEFAVRTGARTTLVGAPHEFAADLAERGFRVIADRKGTDHAIDEKTELLVSTQLALKTSSAATSCSGGFAGAFPCDKVDLLAHVADRTSTARGADIWGFMDLNTDREYAIVGYSIGTAVFDISDPENPREVGFINGQTTTWRDIKVYQYWNAPEQRWNAYAYITADNASDGLFIIDLSQLPQRIARVSYPSDFAEAHNVYLTNTDFSTGVSLTGAAPQLVLAGSNRSDGRFRLYSLANPAAPAFVSTPATPSGQSGGDRLYMHDAASMQITDSRKDSQCVNAAASDYCEVLFDFNESTVDIWDVTDAANPVRLSHTPYGNSGYTHSGWWSEDKQYLYVQDELDERDRGLNTTLRTLSLANLAAPTLAGTWSGPTSAIDHNGFARGNRYYMSNYARGLTILDISSPANPSLAGRFDTYPSSDSTGFPGAWGAYPFLPSGDIIISDIDSGLYVVADKTLDVPEGTLRFAAKSFGANENQAASITVQRSGGGSGAASVTWEIIGASGTLADVTTGTGTLSWPDGDMTDRVINLAFVDDGVAEGLERLLIKLTAPTGGATLSAPNIASVYVSDPGASSEIGFASASVAVAERGFATGVAVVLRTGSANDAASVDYAVTAGDASPGADYTGPAAGTLNWAAGDATPRYVDYAIIDDGSGETTEFFELSLSNAAGATVTAEDKLRIEILDGTGSSNAPNAIAGGNQTVAGGTSVTLDGSGSNDPDGDTLTYLWTQVLGQPVTLSGTDSANASFVAPSVASDTLLRFELLVTDASGLTDVATTTVTVTNGSQPSGGGGGAPSLWLLALLGLLGAARGAIRTDAA